MEDFDTEYTDKVVCPYCGQEDDFSWELHGDEGLIECGWCGEYFRYERHVEVTYSTWKPRKAVE